MIASLVQLVDLKIMSKAKIKDQVDLWREKGDQIVFTNGCFDLMHTGHISYLLKAASFGNKLVIGLNSDSSVKRLKGASRPINDEANRAIMLASMFFVDAVVSFEEDTPLALIKTIMPDVLVKGGDYTIENIVGATEVLNYGGKVEVVKFIEGYSSTALIQKISGK